MREGDGRQCRCDTATGLGKLESGSGVIVSRRGKERWARINVVGCILLEVSKRKKIQGYRASSLCPL
jgi:hypothetical protein